MTEGTLLIKSSDSTIGSRGDLRIPLEPKLSQLSLHHSTLEPLSCHEESYRENCTSSLLTSILATISSCEKKQAGMKSSAKQNLRRIQQSSNDPEMFPPEVGQEYLAVCQ